MSKEELEQIREFNRREDDNEFILHARGWRPGRGGGWFRGKTVIATTLEAAMVSQCHSDIYALLAEIDRLTAELSTARAEALEEAARVCDAEADFHADMRDEFSYGTHEYGYALSRIAAAETLRDAIRSLIPQQNQQEEQQ